MSLAGVQNALERRLTELNRLGLSRPASTLFSEYLAALVAEDVLEPAAVEGLSAAYHRLRYSTGADDPEQGTDDAFCLLDRTVAKLAAMPADDLRELAKRVRSRLGSNVAPAPRNSGSGHQPTASSRVTNEPPWPGPAPGEALETGPVSLEDDGLLTAVRPDATTWLARNRVPLMVAGALCCLLAGYALRPLTERLSDWMDGEFHVAAVPGAARAGWNDRTAWTHALRIRAAAYASKRHDVQARLTYELLLTYIPADPETNNNLAWLYLTSQDESVRDPKRAFELAMVALARNRVPVILDTAAEAHFQTGQFAKAIELEQEALEAVRVQSGPNNSELRKFLENQLEKFRGGPSAASGPHPPAASPARI